MEFLKSLDESARADAEKQIKDAIFAEVEKATKGLVENRDKILDEKKRLQDSIEGIPLDKLKGLDVDELLRLKQTFDQSEEMKLIKDGKIDEVVEARTKRFIDRYERQLEEQGAKLAEVEKLGQDYAGRWKKELLNNSVARSIQGLADGALAKVQRDAADYFDVDDDGKIVPREGAPTGKDGRPITLEGFGDYLREDSPFYFPASNGGGAAGGARNGSQRRVSMGDIGSNLEDVASGKARVDL